jgi:hypothetical protein
MHFPAINVQTYADLNNVESYIFLVPKEIVFCVNVCIITSVLRLEDMSFYLSLCRSHHR